MALFKIYKKKLAKGEARMQTLEFSSAYATILFLLEILSPLPSVRLSQYVTLSSSLPLLPLPGTINLALMKKMELSPFSSSSSLLGRCRGVLLVPKVAFLKKGTWGEFHKTYTVH